MATLDDVQRQVVDVDAGSPRHKESIAEIEPGPFSLGFKSRSVGSRLHWVQMSLS